MNLSRMISCRKSTRSYQDQPVEEAVLQKIRQFSRGLKPLFPDIRVRAEVVDREEIRSMMPWITPQVLAIYTQEAENDLENVGFLYQQMDLYLQSLGLGACWIGMGRPRTQDQRETADGLQFAILLAFGYPKGDHLRSSDSFRRKTLAEISDWEDPRLEPARLAPSSVNSQPWYFVHDGETVHVYCVLPPLRKVRTLGAMNRIDMGIALAHMYVSNPETFRFFRTETAPERKGFRYMGSFTV